MIEHGKDIRKRELRWSLHQVLISLNLKLNGELFVRIAIFVILDGSLVLSKMAYLLIS